VTFSNNFGMGKIKKYAFNDQLCKACNDFFYFISKLANYGLAQPGKNLIHFL